MVPRWSGGGGWSSRAEAWQRPKVSKLRVKGLSDYHSNETVVKAARQGASWLNKGLLSRHVSSKRRAKKQLLVWRKKGQNAASQMKSTTGKKYKIAYSNSEWWCIWEKWKRWWRWWVRTSWANHKSMWQRLRVKRQKVGLNRQPIAYTAEGAWFSPNT
jgi:hypothetical protein